MSDAVRSTRKDYAKGGLKKDDLPVNPMDLMSQWVEEAAAADPEDYNAMCIATQNLAGESTVGLYCFVRWKMTAFAFSQTMNLRRERNYCIT